MLFSSIPFLYLYLPCVVMLYFLAPKRAKNYVLLAASLFFYAWGEPRFVGIMAAEILLAYLFGLGIEKYRAKAPAKLLLAASLLAYIAVLGYFKYAGFFVAAFGQMTGLSIKVRSTILPIGISFYTFQIISYTIDVCKGRTRAQRNPFLLALYIAMFPQLIAGPIIRYTDIETQLYSRTHSIEKAAYGVRRFLLGLSKKVLLADALGELCNTFHASQDLSVVYYWLYAIAFTLQIYFDFSGYSDMAIGLGRIFGFDFGENFNYPYISKSVTEFWRRWHTSLGSWFRDYVYIPLGGNRVSKRKWLRNIAVVWCLTGFWHGAAWNFMVWGIFFAVFLVLEKCFYGRWLARARGWNHIYVLFLVCISFVIFQASDMGEAASNIACMLGMGKLPLISTECLYYLKSYAGLLAFAIVGATPFPKWLAQKLPERAGAVLEPLLLIGLLLLVTAYLVDGSFQPFLYFRF